MAAPETQFQPATIQAPYQFTPSQYHPQAVSIGPWAGQAYAELGKNALAAAAQVGDAIRKSTFNPLVRSQMNYQIASNTAAAQHIKDMQDTGLGFLTEGTSPAGGTTMPLGATTDPTLAAFIRDVIAKRMNLGGAGKTEGTTDGKTDGTGAQGDQGTKKVEQGPPTTEEQAGGKKQTQVTTPPTSLFASNSTVQPPVPGQRPYYSASTDQGPIPTTASTTDTGFIAPLATQGVVSQRAAAQGMPVTQRGPVWNPLQPAPVQPQPPAAPGQQPAAQQPTQQPSAQEATPGTEPGSLSDQYARDYAAGHAQGQEARRQQDLTAWQAKTQTEPITADDAMSWIRRKTTLAKDATYMPNGGPNGEPAYAFHMRTPGGKGTGVNVVPISQMIKDGAAPTAASQNTSAMLSQSDKLQQQQQNALAVPPPAPTDQTGQVAQQPMGPTAGGAPAMQPTGNVTGAPTGSFATLQQPGQQPQQGGQVWNPLQPTPGPTAGPPPAPSATPAPAMQPTGNVTGAPTGPLSTAYDPTLYRQAALAAAANPQALAAEAGQEAGTRTDVGTQQPKYGPDSPILAPPPQGLTPAQQDAVAARAEKNKNVNHFDAYGFGFDRDTDPKSKYYGKMFLSLPGTAGNYYDQQRFYMGAHGYQLYELPLSNMQKQMDYWVERGTDYHGHAMTRQDVEGMSADEMRPWLDQKWKDANLKPAEGSDIDLDTAEQFHMSVQRIKNLVQALGGAEQDSGRYNVAAKMIASLENAAVSLGQGDIVKNLPTDLIRYVPPEAARAIRTLEQEVNGAQKMLQDHPNLLIALEKGGGQETPNVHWGGGGIGLPNVPESNALGDVFSGQPQADIMRNLDNLQKRGDFRYNEMLENARTESHRANPRHAANIARINTGVSLPDDSDAYKSKSIFHSGAAASGAGAQPTIHPVPSTMGDYRNIPDHEQYYPDEESRKANKPVWKNGPPGVPFQKFWNAIGLG